MAKSHSPKQQMTAPANYKSYVTAYLRSILPSTRQIDRFIGKTPNIKGYSPNAGWTYDSELGWVLRDAIRYDGLDGSKTFYHYEDSGARERTQFPDIPARIHTYGDSFTHGDQVNDGETWQEYLAAHLGEPIENFGVGGYSVYQAYLRMKRVESLHPAQYIVLNIYDDDHFRNLVAWRQWSLPRGVIPREGTLPYVRVNVGKQQLIELSNPCRARRDVYKLRNAGWLWETFGHDVALRIAAARAARRVPRQYVLEAATDFGLSHHVNRTEHAAKAELERIYTRAALFSTMTILDMAHDYITQSRKRLLLILSYSPANVTRYLRGERSFDQSLIDYLKARRYRYVDLREHHLAEFEKVGLSPKDYVNRYYIGDYVKRYYIGHYSPAGNFFCAMAMKNKIVRWLDPRPQTYSKKRASYE